MALTRYTKSTAAAMMLVAAYVQQLRQGEGAYFAWSETEIGAEIGITRRAILTARAQLRRLKLLDWGVAAGRRAVYVVNTDLVAEILRVNPDPPADSPDPARNARADVPASSQNGARSARVGNDEAPAQTPNPARSARVAGVETPAGFANPARSAREPETDPPAESIDPARSARVSDEDAPAESTYPARLTLESQGEAPASTPNPAPTPSPLAPPEPPRTPLDLGTISFSSTSTLYASAGAAQNENPPATDSTQNAGAPNSVSEGQKSETADHPGAVLLKRCGLTGSQIRAAVQRYTAEQITQAVDRVRALRQEGRCNKPVAMLVSLLKTGDWPTSDTSAFDEPPTQPAYAGQPGPTTGRPYLPPMAHWQTMAEREAQIAAYRKERGPIDGFFGALLGRGLAAPEGRAALCARS